MRKKWLSVFMTLTMVMVWTSCSDETSDLATPGDDAAAKKVLPKSDPNSKFDPLSVTCGVSSKSTITVTVTAGASGAPAGFSLQWMTASAYALYGWESDVVCKGSFSGNANSSRYELGANASVELTIGDLAFDNGASTTCPDFLECGTEYVFRTFAHATSSKYRSDFSSNYSCSTADCDGGCTYGKGYWKNNPDAWPIDELELGSVTYSKQQLLDIYDLPVGGNPQEANAFTRLAHHLIAAILNVENGATTSQTVLQAIADAHALLGNYDILTGNPVYTSNSTEGQQANAIKDILEAYNNGNLCQDAG